MSFLRSVFIVFILTIFPLQNCGSQVDFGNLVSVRGDRFIVRLRYNSEDNYFHKNFYSKYSLSDCYLHRDLYDKILKIIPRLKELKLKLVFWDCYRPLEVQRDLWAYLPNPKYVANPQTGSNHNRAIAVDCTLSDESGKELEFPSVYDDFSDKASHKYKCTKAEEKLCQHRELLAKLMKEAGINLYKSEWWHYQLNKENYPIINVLPNKVK